MEKIEESETPEEILEELESKDIKKTTKKENKQLKNILIGLGIFVFLIVVGVIFINSIRKVGYDGVKFEVVKEGDLIFYNTKIPLYNSEGQHYKNYNFFLRNNPKDLEKVKFNGDLTLNELVVIDSEEEFGCDGDGIIAVANLNLLYEILGAKVIKDETASCDSGGKYMYINLKSGDETKIEEIGASCYEISINNCKILEGTERFMLETFVKVNEALPK